MNDEWKTPGEYPCPEGMGGRRPRARCRGADCAPAEGWTTRTPRPLRHRGQRILPVPNLRPSNGTRSDQRGGRSLASGNGLAAGGRPTAYLLLRRGRRAAVAGRAGAGSGPRRFALLDGGNAQAPLYLRGEGGAAPFYPARLPATA